MCIFHVRINGSNHFHRSGYAKFGIGRRIGAIHTRSPSGRQFARGIIGYGTFLHRELSSSTMETRCDAKKEGTKLKTKIKSLVSSKSIVESRIDGEYGIQR
jgi:hypothetical protein